MSAEKPETVGAQKDQVSDPVPEETPDTEAAAPELEPETAETQDEETVTPEATIKETVPAEPEAEAEAPAAEVTAPVPGADELNWYVVQTYSGFETRVQQSLEERIKAAGLSDVVPQVMVPSEEVLEIKSGKKRKSSRKFFPGYVLVQADMTDEVWHLIKDVPKVTGFVGGRRPQPLEPEEVGSLLYQLETGVRPPRATADFSVGDKVRIIEGPFSGFVASVDEVIESQSKLKVMVTIFGRSTPVELGFLQVEAA